MTITYDESDRLWAVEFDDGERKTFLTNEEAEDFVLGRRLEESDQ